MTADDAPIDAILRAVVAERDVAVRERDEARAERDRIAAVLEHALRVPGCIVEPEIRRAAAAALAVPAPPTDEDKRTPR